MKLTKILLIMCFIALTLNANVISAERRKADYQETIKEWEKEAENSIEKKDWLRALQFYQSVIEANKKINIDIKPLLGKINYLFWYCVSYYCLSEKKNYKDALWFLTQRLERMPEDIETKLLIELIEKQDDTNIVNFLDKKFSESLIWSLRNCKEKFCSPLWWFEKRLEITPNSTNIKKCYEEFLKQ